MSHDADVEVTYGPCGTVKSIRKRGDNMKNNNSFNKEVISLFKRIASLFILIALIFLLKF